MTLPELPPGFRSVTLAGARFAVREDWAERFAAWGLGPSDGEPYEPTELEGRATLVAIRGSEGDVLVRRYRHGGLLAPLTGARYATPDRPFEELVLSERLRSLGLGTPEVLAARARRARPFGWRLELFTRRVRDSVDLGTRIEARRAGRLDDRGWHALVRRFGSLVGRSHAAGFLHADLHPKNVLERDDGELLFVDLDRSRLLAEVDAPARVANLERLWRWVAREHGRAPFLGAGDAARFLRAWSAAGGGAWRDAHGRVAELHARHASVHRVGRRLQGRR